MGTAMKFLTRQEEQVLLAVFRLKDNACLISIQAHLSHLTVRDWSISSVYVPLSRLEKGLSQDENRPGDGEARGKGH